MRNKILWIFIGIFLLGSTNLLAIQNASVNQILQQKSFSNVVDSSNHATLNNNSQEAINAVLKNYQQYDSCVQRIYQALLPYIKFLDRGFLMKIAHGYCMLATGIGPTK